MEAGGSVSPSGRRRLRAGVRTAAAGGFGFGARSFGAMCSVYRTRALLGAPNSESILSRQKNSPLLCFLPTFALELSDSAFGGMRLAGGKKNA